MNANHSLQSCYATLGQVMHIYWLQCMTKIFWLTIFVAAPNISFPVDSQQFTDNEQTDITFMCAASGSPAPTISFIYEGQTLIRTDGKPISLVGPLASRVMLGSETVARNTMTSLYEVTRNFTLFNAVQEDSVNLSCSASADIPGAGLRFENVSFSLLVFRKYVDEGYV